MNRLFIDALREWNAKANVLFKYVTAFSILSLSSLFITIIVGIRCKPVAAASLYLHFEAKLILIMILHLQ